MERQRPTILEVLGAPASGKTTLCQAVAGALPPSVRCIEREDLANYVRRQKGSLLPWSIRRLPWSRWKMACLTRSICYARHAQRSISRYPRPMRLLSSLTTMEVASEMSDVDLVLTDKGPVSSALFTMGAPFDEIAIQRFTDFWRCIARRLVVRVVWIECPPELAWQRAAQRAEGDRKRQQEVWSGEHGLDALVRRKRELEAAFAAVESAGADVIRLDTCALDAQEAARQTIQWLDLPSRSTVKKPPACGFAQD